MVWLGNGKIHLGEFNLSALQTEEERERQIEIRSEASDQWIYSLPFCTLWAHLWNIIAVGFAEATE